MVERVIDSLPEQTGIKIKGVMRVDEEMDFIAVERYKSSSKVYLY